MPTKKGEPHFSLKAAVPHYTALIITKSAFIKKTIKFILNDTIHCQNVRSAPEGKQFFKASTNIKVLILDWALQDKYGSNMKCLKEAKARKNVLVVNIFQTVEQKNWVFNHLPNLQHNNKIYSITDDFIGISLPITLLRLKKRLRNKLKT